MSKRGVLRGGIVAVVAAGAFAAAPATTALAAGYVECSWIAGSYGCSKSETITPRYDHTIWLGARSDYRAHPVTCRAFDAANGVEVGAWTTSTPYWYEGKRIPGLYGRYFLACTGDRQSVGKGSISGD